MNLLHPIYDSVMADQNFDPAMVPPNSRREDREAEHERWMHAAISGVRLRSMSVGIRAAGAKMGQAIASARANAARIEARTLRSTPTTKKAVPAQRRPAKKAAPKEES